MSLTDKVVGVEELASALGWKVDWVKRNWLRLHQNEGMPRKLPSSWSWPRRSVEAWIDSRAGEAATGARQGREPAPGSIPGSLDVIVANENQRLRARYGGRA